MDKIIFNNLVQLIKQKISHEKTMLEDMRNNTHTIPKDWSLSMQQGFIKGMEHTLMIMLNPEKFQD